LLLRLKLLLQVCDLLLQAQRILLGRLRSLLHVSAVHN